MSLDAVPTDLAAALLRAGFRLAGPVGVGSHGPAWVAVGREGGPAEGRRVVVTMLASSARLPDVDLRARLDALSEVRHEHLAEIVAVVAVGEPRTGSAGTGSTDSGSAGTSRRGAAPRRSRAGTRWAVLVAEVPGTDLAAFLAARPPLRDGEAVTLTVPIAGALAALHAAGFVHGDVSPANIVLTPDGRPMLVDLLGAVSSVSSAGLGTPGFVAPEATRARSIGPRRPAADVYALGCVARSALGDLPGAALRAVLDHACAVDPAARPSASEFATRSYCAAAPQPLAMPEAAVLARIALARLASGPSPRSGSTVRPPRSRHRVPRARVRAALRDPMRTSAGTAQRAAPWSARVPVVGAAVVGALVIGALVVGGLAARGYMVGDRVRPGDASPDLPARAATSPAVRAEPGPATPAADPAATGPGTAVTAPTDPVDAAVALTEQRAGALEHGDPAGLAEIDLEGSGAHQSDLELLGRLAAAGERLDGLAVTVLSARLVEGIDSAPDGGYSEIAAGARVRVEITSAPTAHRRTSAAGAAPLAVPAQPPRTVVLELVWTPQGWRVAEVAQPAVVPGAVSP